MKKYLAQYDDIGEIENIILIDRDYDDEIRRIDRVNNVQQLQLEHGRVTIISEPKWDFRPNQNISNYRLVSPNGLDIKVVRPNLRHRETTETTILIDTDEMILFRKRGDEINLLLPAGKAPLAQGRGKVIRAFSMRINNEYIVSLTGDLEDI